MSKGDLRAMMPILSSLSSLLNSWKSPAFLQRTSCTQHWFSHHRNCLLVAVQTGSAVVARVSVAVCTHVWYGQTLGSCSTVVPFHEVGGMCLRHQYPLVCRCQMWKRMMTYRSPGSTVGILGSWWPVVCSCHYCIAGCRCMQSYCDVDGNAGVHMWIHVSPGCGWHVKVVAFVLCMCIYTVSAGTSEWGLWSPVEKWNSLRMHAVVRRV